MATTAAKQQDACPWCGQAIPHKQFVEIEARIRAQEKRRLEAADAEAQAKLAAEREALEIRYKAERTSHELTLQKLKEQLERAKEEQVDFDKRLKDAIEAAAASERKKIEAVVARQVQAERERER